MSRVARGARLLLSATRVYRSKLRLGLLAVVSIAFCVACESEPTPNLLLISFDTTRADRLSAYGYPEPTSPNVDAIAQRGARFKRAFTHAPSTLPAHTSLLTGLLPPRHGVRANGRYQLGAAPSTLGEVLSSHEYSTGAVVSGFPLDETFGLGRGFDHYDGDFRSGRKQGHFYGQLFAAKERPASEVTDHALSWLKDQDSPWFLFVHYFDPHAPYEAPPPYSESFRDPYDAEIAYADAELGRLLDAVADDESHTLVAFTSDHGEGLGEHGEEEHNVYLFNSTLSVPLLISFPGVVPEGSIFETPVAHVDVVPTLLDLLGFPIPEALDGRSLASAMLSGREPHPRPIYAEALERGTDAERGVRLQALIEEMTKLIYTEVHAAEGRRAFVELYDLGDDPRELKNLALERRDRVDRKLKQLSTWINDLAGTAFPSKRYEPDEQDLEALKALGYIDP